MAVRRAPIPQEMSSFAHRLRSWSNVSVTSEELEMQDLYLLYPKGILKFLNLIASDTDQCTDGGWSPSHSSYLAILRRGTHFISTGIDRLARAALQLQVVTVLWLIRYSSCGKH